MSQSLEERLRAHFADRAAREPLPGPEGDAALERARGAGEPGAVGVDRRADGRRTGRVLPFVRRRPVLVAAAAVVVLAVAAGLVAVDDERTRVSTDPTPAPTAPPDTSPGSTSRSTSNTTAPPSAGDRPTGPIVGVEGILGSWSGSGWVPWEPGATPPDGDEYKIVRLDQPIATRAGAATAQVCGTVPIIDVGLHYTGNRLDPLPIAWPVSATRGPGRSRCWTPRHRCTGRPPRPSSPGSASTTRRRRSSRSCEVTSTRTARPRSSSWLSAWQT